MSGSAYVTGHGTVFYLPPPGTALVVTALQITHVAGTDDSITVFADSVANPIATVSFTEIGTRDQTFPTGVVVKADMFADHGYVDGSVFIVNYSGYLIPAVACTTGHMCGH